MSVSLLLITGNDILHYLLSQVTYEMRLDIEDFDAQTRHVKYTSFNVGNGSSKYIVTLSGFSGNVGENSRILYFTISQQKFDCFSKQFVIHNLCQI